MFRTKQTTIHNLYLAHNGSIIYIVRSPTDGKPQCQNIHNVGDRNTMWITNQCDVFLDTKNLQTNEGLRRGELCPCNNKSLSKKDLQNKILIHFKMFTIDTKTIRYGYNNLSEFYQSEIFALWNFNKVKYLPFGKCYDKFKVNQRI